jgi:Pectinacetylesterase
MKNLIQQKMLKSFTGPRAARLCLWGLLFIITMVAIPKFNADAVQVPHIGAALNCGRGKYMPPGNDLFRVDVNTTNFPNAKCNDDSGAVFYVRRASNADDRNKWQIHLQGGGGCRDGQSCADRWRRIDTNFGADEMSTTFRT